ncbi:hypothetical protein T484DRAFT_1766899 [Baffinella frigidus]|nr:hypothetical protein T484DRAFT_1766899 [Cryptophyta sp. CCMP2293]
MRVNTHARQSPLIGLPAKCDGSSASSLIRRAEMVLMGGDAFLGAWGIIGAAAPREASGPLERPPCSIAPAQRLPRAVVAGERNVSVKQLRLRLAAVTSIQRITKTMKMVAAAKLKGFQTRMIAARPLGEQINFLVSQIPPPAEEVRPRSLSPLK